MGNCLSGCLSVATCGLCGPRKNSKSRRSRDAREPLLGQGRGQNGTPTLTDGPVTAMAGPSRGERKPPNTTNILGFGMRDVNEDYILGDVLGEGAFGTVRRCRHRRDASEYACKTVLKEQLKRRADVEDVRREVQILWMISNHPNVAGLRAVYEDNEAVHLILDLCEGGQLFDEICAQGTISERDVAKYFRKMVEVVHHCHTLGIAHRDIKPENFLLSQSGPEGKVKAADFGLSQFFRPGKPFRSLVGSAYYVAPEVLNRDYGPKADVWSLGVCLYILLTGLTPFWGDTEEEVFGMVLNADVDFQAEPWPLLSRPAKDIVQKMLQRDPARRPSAQQLLQHQWLCQAAPDAPLPHVVIQRIRSFAAMTRVKRAAMLVAAQNLEEQGMPQMAALFDVLDVDKTGSLNADEVRVGLGRKGIAVTDDALNRLMEGANTDGSPRKTLTKGEFLAAALGHSKERRDEMVRNIFMMFDASGAGALSRDDLYNVLKKYGISKEDVADLMAGVDADGDGLLSLEEFSAWMGHNTGSLQEAARRRWHAAETSSPEKRPLTDYDSGEDLDGEDGQR